MAPVAFRLGMDLGIAVHFRSGSLKNHGPGALGQPEHVDGAVHARLDGLHRIVLVMHGRGGAGQIVDLVHFHIQRKGHVMPEKLKARVPPQRLHIAARAGEKVVHAKHFMPFGQQPFAQMRTDKAGTACNKNPFSQVHDAVSLRLAGRKNAGPENAGFSRTAFCSDIWKSFRK